MKKVFNPHRILLVHQHGRCFIVLVHQYGLRDVMWKRSIMGGRPSRSYQGLDASRSLPRVINSFRLLKSATKRSKSSGDNVNAVLPLQSFQFVFEKLNAIVRLRATENKKYISTSNCLFVIYFWTPKAEDPESTICQSQMSGLSSNNNFAE